MGNHFTVICNEKFWMDVQSSLADYLSKWKTAGTFLWSKAKNGYVNVGATYNTYEMGGNTLTFQVDRTFSREFGMSKGFAMMVDLTADKTTGQPAILVKASVAAA